MVRLKRKDEKQDKEIDELKKQLKTLTTKYLKKRKKETKGQKDKYKKIKDRITKRSTTAQSKGDIAKLIAMLKQGVGSAGGSKSTTTPQPIIQQTPATMGTIDSRISTDKKKKPAQDPIKLWRELKTNWSDLKDKYKNDTISREDIVNMWNKAKKLATAVQDDTLLLVAEITAMYGIGKQAYEYIMRFINKHRPQGENPVNTADTPPPTPPPDDSGGSGGSGDDTTPTEPTPTPTPTPTPAPTPPAEEGERRGQGLGRFSDARAPDTPPPKDRPDTQSWSDYLKASLQTGLATTGAMGLGGLYTLHTLNRGFGRLRGGRLEQRERPERIEGGGQVGEVGVLGNVAGNVAERIGGAMLRPALEERVQREMRRLRERGREEDTRTKFGEINRDLENTDVKRPPEGLERTGSSASEMSETSSEASVEVNEIELGGKPYLEDAQGQLYDPETFSPVSRPPMVEVEIDRSDRSPPRGDIGGIDTMPIDPRSDMGGEEFNVGELEGGRFVEP